MPGKTHGTRRDISPRAENSKKQQSPAQREQYKLLTAVAYERRARRFTARRARRLFAMSRMMMRMEVGIYRHFRLAAKRYRNGNVTRRLHFLPSSHAITLFNYNDSQSIQRAVYINTRSRFWQIQLMDVFVFLSLHKGAAVKYFPPRPPSARTEAPMLRRPDFVSSLCFRLPTRGLRRPLSCPGGPPPSNREPATL